MSIWSPAGARAIPTRTHSSPSKHLTATAIFERLEHRQQYKVNAFRQFKLGRHELTLFGVGYYGFSYVPGLIPINTFVPDDTVDRRQLDRTHTSIFVASDTWRIERPESTHLLRILPHL